MDKKSRALYLTLAEQLAGDISSGLLKPGTKLPPQRELADFLDINVSTVSKAFKQCELKGLLSATVGAGTYVSYDALTSSRLLSEPNDRNIIDLGATVPESSGNEILMELLRKMVSESEADQLFSYHPSGEKAWHKDAAVFLLRCCGHYAEENQILFANGGQNALSAVLSALFRRGDKVAVDGHTYPGIKTAAAMFGIQLVPVTQDAEGMNEEALEFICKTEKISGIYVIPACHNPTTVTMPQGRREAIARIVKKYGCILVEDGTYQLMSSGFTAISDYVQEQSVYIASLSKAIAPGLRMAILSVSPQYKSAVSDALYSLNVAVVPMMAELSARIITSGKFETIIENHKKYTAERNAIVDRWLPGKICRGSRIDVFRWLLIPEKYTGTEFEMLALSEGVQVYAAERFAVGKTLPAHAVRLSICAPKDLEQLEQGMKIVSKLMRK